MTHACREHLEAAVASIALDFSQEPCAVILSGGVDTCAAMAAVSAVNAANNQKVPKLEVKAAMTVFASPTATDRKYAPVVAQRHGLEHHQTDISLEELLGMLPFCVRVLRTFDGMQLRNSMVVALALHKLKALGYKLAITGDGSDELLGGYSFTWGGENDEAGWKAKRDVMAHSMTYTCPAMAAELGMCVRSPFLEHTFLQWAIELEPDTSRQMHITGKVCLREAYPESFGAWRRKDPIEVGSGSTEMGKYIKEQISREEFESERERVAAEDHIQLVDEEHLYNYRVFKSVFPSGLGEKRGMKAKYPCNSCGYDLPSSTELFCYVCGKYPAQ
ncbi:hypothetical protein CYMTET_20909 [Cymbomonas tetramitiformis]|uniref:Asparagine synthetase domain-containing protein n=1 Tax=Cymbomonas tetramitiformis TaxID=36881 RepID=A0AAE0L3I7_9CHLO|nr:hypothetical protein CYMTET_20909 [Cymbomonas tetramitiformis]